GGGKRAGLARLRPRADDGDLPLELHPPLHHAPPAAEYRRGAGELLLARDPHLPLAVVAEVGGLDDAWDPDGLHRGDYVPVERLGVRRVGEPVRPPPRPLAPAVLADAQDGGRR